MGTLLYIQASPRGERSYALRAAEAFVGAYQQRYPDDTVVTKNLFTMDLPAFDGLAVQAKYAILHGQRHTGEELAAWRAVEAAIEEFEAADKYVLATPMWNFGIPYRLKQYIDVLVQPGYTFSYSPDEGYKGLVTGKPIFIAYSRGGRYGAGTPGETFDMQKKYLELILGFVGFREVESVVVEPTLQEGKEVAEHSLQAAISKAQEIAQTF